MQEGFVNGIDVEVLFRDVIKEYGNHLRGHLDVIGHPRLGENEVLYIRQVASTADVRNMIFIL